MYTGLQWELNAYKLIFQLKQALLTILIHVFPLLTCFEFFPVTTHSIAAKTILGGPKSLIPMEDHYKEESETIQLCLFLL